MNSIFRKLGSLKSDRGSSPLRPPLDPPLTILNTSTRLDIVWGRYLENSLKDITRENGGVHIRIKVSGSAKIPVNFRDFYATMPTKESYSASCQIA